MTSNGSYSIAQSESFSFHLLLKCKFEYNH